MSGIKTAAISSKTYKTRFQYYLRHGDRPWQFLIISMSVLVLVLIIAIGCLLWQQSADTRAKFGWNFILPTQTGNWDPVNSNFDSWPFIYGTLLTSLVAILMAVPISVGVAVFLAELSPGWLRGPLGVMIELLAAIPSVVYGLWGIFVFLPLVISPLGNIMENSLGKVPLLQYFFAGPIPISGSSRLAAALILAIMIIPTISAVTRDVFMAIPGSQREASLALGATQWETISKVLIPYGSSGILGAAILGSGPGFG